MGFTRFLHRLFGARSRIRLPETAWERALRRPAWTRGLDFERKRRLREFTERFLAEKAITGAGGMDLTDDRRVLIAMLCCRPVLELDFRWLDGWHQVIVYPGQYQVRARDHDPHTGVVHEYDSHRAGESWRHGPVLLSWADVRACVDNPEPGYDVVVHEIAHKLDGLHGMMDGAPRLPAREAAGWARDFQAAFDSLHATLSAGGEPPIDPYAAEAPEEFFAVCSEYWFTAPEVLRAAYPAVAQRLKSFYGEVATAT
jgi:Mlc titration factor MtfA (ptsG expression regulator)